MLHKQPLVKFKGNSCHGLSRSQTTSISHEQTHPSSGMTGMLIFYGWLVSNFVLLVPHNTSQPCQRSDGTLPRQVMAATSQGIQQPSGIGNTTVTASGIGNTTVTGVCFCLCIL